MTAKKIFGKLHLWLGLASGLVVFIVALTGSIMVFEKELELIFHKKFYYAENARGERRSYEELKDSLLNHYTVKKIRRFQIFENTERTVLFSIEENKKRVLQVAIDPYTGAIRGEREPAKNFFRGVLQLHRYLCMGDAGKLITGISCLIFLVMIISGMILWWPKTKKIMKQRLKIKWGASFKRVNWDMHAAFGFYSSIFLFAIALTGLVWAYPLVNKMIYQLADGKPQPKFEARNKSAIGITSKPGLFDKIVAEANRQYTFTGDLNITIPANDTLGIAISKENKDVKLAGISSQVYFDRSTGELLKLRPYELESRGSKIRRLVLPIHTGSAYGWPTKIIAFIVALFAASLPVTGTLIWLNRIKKKKGKTAGAKIPATRKSVQEVLVTNM